MVIGAIPLVSFFFLDFINFFIIQNTPSLVDRRLEYSLFNRLLQKRMQAEDRLRRATRVFVNRDACEQGRVDLPNHFAPERRECQEGKGLLPKF